MPHLVVDAYRSVEAAKATADVPITETAAYKAKLAALKAKYGKAA